MCNIDPVTHEWELQLFLSSSSSRFIQRFWLFFYDEECERIRSLSVAPEYSLYQSILDCISPIQAEKLLTECAYQMGCAITACGNIIHRNIQSKTSIMMTIKTSSNPHFILCDFSHAVVLQINEKSPDNFEPIYEWCEPPETATFPHKGFDFWCLGGSIRAMIEIANHCGSLPKTNKFLYDFIEACAIEDVRKRLERISMLNLIHDLNVHYAMPFISSVNEMTNKIKQSALKLKSGHFGSMEGVIPIHAKNIEAQRTAALLGTLSIRRPHQVIPFMEAFFCHDFSDLTIYGRIDVPFLVTMSDLPTFLARAPDAITLAKILSDAVLHCHEYAKFMVRSFDYNSIATSPNGDIRIISFPKTRQIMPQPGWQYTVFQKCSPFTSPRVSFNGSYDESVDVFCVCSIVFNFCSRGIAFPTSWVELWSNGNCKDLSLLKMMRD